MGATLAAGKKIYDANKDSIESDQNRSIFGNAANTVAPGLAITDRLGYTHAGSENSEVGRGDVAPLGVGVTGKIMANDKFYKLKKQAAEDADAQSAEQARLNAMKPDPGRIADQALADERNKLRKRNASRTLFSGEQGLSDKPTTASTVLLGA